MKQFNEVILRDPDATLKKLLHSGQNDKSKFKIFYPPIAQNIWRDPAFRHSGIPQKAGKGGKNILHFDM